MCLDDHCWLLEHHPCSGCGSCRLRVFGSPRSSSWEKKRSCATFCRKKLGSLIRCQSIPCWQRRCQMLRIVVRGYPQSVVFAIVDAIDQGEIARGFGRVRAEILWRSRGTRGKGVAVRGRAPFQPAITILNRRRRVRFRRVDSPYEARLCGASWSLTVASRRQSNHNTTHVHGGSHADSTVIR